MLLNSFKYSHIIAFFKVITYVVERCIHTHQKAANQRRGTQDSKARKSNQERTSLKPC